MTRRTRTYRAALEAAQPVKRCVGCGRTDGDFEADHVVPLAENGPSNFTAWRCIDCHKKKTAREAAERAARRRGAKVPSRTRKPAPPPVSTPGRWSWVLPAAVLGCFAYAAAWLFLGHHESRVVAATWVAMMIFTAVGIEVRARRRAVVERLALTLARDMNTAPHDLRIKVHDWRGWTPLEWTVRYSPLAPDDDPDWRRTIEATASTKTGVAIFATWEPAADRVRFRERTDDDPAEEAYRNPEPVAAPLVGVVEEAVRGVIKGEVKMTVTQADEQGRPLAFTLAYPSTFRDDDDGARAGVQAVIAHKAPGRWRATWDTHANRVRFEHRPQMAEVIPHPVPTDIDDTWRLPLGVDEHGEVLHWDLKVAPHALVAGSTGGGKTVVLSGILTEALARGFEVVIVDGKGTALAGFRDWPGVRKAGLGEAEDMADAMEYAETIMRRRYRDIRERGAEPEDFTPMLVILDEAAEFATNVGRWWRTLPAIEVDEVTGDKNRRPKDAPALDAWRSIARLGREGHVHLVVGIQQAAAAFFGGTESRDQLPARIACGPMTDQGARMMFGRQDIGRDVPKALKGRATVDMGDGPVEAQMYWTPTPKADGSIRPADRAILDALMPRPVVPPVVPPPHRPVVPAEPQQPLPDQVRVSTLRNGAWVMLPDPDRPGYDIRSKVLDVGERDDWDQVEIVYAPEDGGEGVCEIGWDEFLVSA